MPVTPKATFLLRLAQRHPEIDAPACLEDVQGELRKRAIPFDAYLRRDLLTTTNPKGLTNPRGYYRDLAKKMIAEHQKQMAGIPTEAMVETPRCAKCNGGGYLLELIEGQRPLQTGEFCDCKLGKDLAAIERRAAKKAEASVEPKQPREGTDHAAPSASSVSTHSVWEKLFMQRKLATGGGHVEAQRASRQISDAPRRRALWRTRRAVRKPRRNVLPRLPRRRCVTRQAAFLAAFRKTASIPSAAKAAGIRPAQHYRWLASDAAYWQAFAEVQEDVIVTLQDTALGRIRDGWVKPLLYRGRVCGTIRTHPVRLHLFLLKAWIPEKWG